MISLSVRRVASVAWLASFSVVLSPARAEAECTEAISDVSSRRLFDALVAAKPGDGCTLENVATDRSEIKVVWARGGQSQEAIRIVPTSCADAKTSHSKFSAMAPDSVATACPAATATTRQLVEADALGELVRISAPVRFAWLRRYSIAVIAGAAALMAVSGGAFVARRSSKRRRHDA